MKYYTYNNPNKTGKRTEWGSDANGLQLENLVKGKCLWMRDDEDNPPEIPSAGDPVNGGGHACCTDDTLITHPGFTEVTAGSPDGTAYWDACKVIEDALRAAAAIWPPV